MPNISFVFQGQGSQYVGMGKDFYDSFESSKNIYETSIKHFDKLKDICFCEDLNGELDKTINTQPCMFVTEYAMAVALMESIKPYSLAGFSLGEITALSIAGCFSFEKGLSLISKRALFMDEATKLCNTGMVACLKLSDYDIQKIASNYNHIYPVNYNCDGQVVVSCLNDDLEKFCQEVKSSGGRTLKLNVSGGFHSPFMNSAKVKMQDFLTGFELCSPNLPVYSNVDSKKYPEDVEKIKNNISNQIDSAVLWKDIIKNMISDGTDVFVEIGPSKTLSGFIKKIDSSVKVFTVDSVNNLTEALSNLKTL